MKLEFTHRVRGAGGTLYSTTRDPNWTKISRQILINKFEKVCKLFEQATILQIAHFLNHVTPDPGGDLPSRGVQKDTPFGPRLQNDPILEPCNARSRWRFTIQRGPKNALPKSLHFWGSPFLDPFCPDPRAICLKTWSPVQNPLFGPMSHQIQVVFYHLKGVPFQPFFIWGHFLDTFGW